MRDNSSFMNTVAPIRLDPSTGGFYNPDVTIEHVFLYELYEWSQCDSLSSDHRPITITLNLPAERQKGKKRLVWDWMNDNLPTFTNEVEDQIPQECESRGMKVDKMHECNPIEGSPKTHWDESGGNGWTVYDDESDQRQFEGTRSGPSKRWHQHRST